jgi:flagellar motor switch protein FliG
MPGCLAVYLALSPQNAEYVVSKVASTFSEESRSQKAIRKKSNALRRTMAARSLASQQASDTGEKSEGNRNAQRACKNAIYRA